VELVQVNLAAAVGRRVGSNGHGNETEIEKAGPDRTGAGCAAGDDPDPAPCGCGAGNWQGISRMCGGLAAENVSERPPLAVIWLRGSNR